MQPFLTAFYKLFVPTAMLLPYHKLDGCDGSKHPVCFTDEEKIKLKGALVDLADRIRRAADNIE